MHAGRLCVAQKDPEVSILTTENELGQLTLPLKSLGFFFFFLLVIEGKNKYFF